MKLFYLICAAIWIATLVSLLRRRDIAFRRKQAWVAAVLVLNVIGVLLYFLIGPRRVCARPPAEAEIDPGAEPVLPEGTAWNPILGENRFPPGQGLNPKADDKAVTP